MTKSKPYKAEPRCGGSAYWILVDTRTGEIASYPTTERNAKAEARMMNRLFNEMND